MLTVNGPFVAALIVIFVIMAIKLIELHLAKKTDPNLKKAAINSPKDAIDLPKDANNLSKDAIDLSNDAPGLKVRIQNALGHLFYREADLNRPWYVSIPLVLFIMSQHTIVKLYELGRSQAICYIALGVLILIGLDILIMLKANKEFFSESGRKIGYIKSQIAQLILTVVIVSLIIGGITLYEKIKYADPTALKESVDWAIEPIFEESRPYFSEGLAVVSNGEGYGYMDKSGQIAIPYRYDDAYPFKNGLGAVRKNGKWGYIDENGNEVIDFAYEDAFAFEEGLAPVQKNEKWGYIDESGNVVVGFLYDETYGFSEGLASVKIGEQWAVIDQTGRELFRLDCQRIGPFHEGVAAIEQKDIQSYGKNKCNLIDREGNLLFSQYYGYVDECHEGYIMVQNRDTYQYSFLNKKGERVIPVDFFSANSFFRGYAAVSPNYGKYFFIDNQGNLIGTLSEEGYYNFQREGLVIFSEKGKKLNFSTIKTIRYGCKDLYGNIVIPADFQGIYIANDGMIGLKVDGRWGLVKNPLPEAARTVDPDLWKEDRTQIASVEGLPVYAGELETLAYSLMMDKKVSPGIPSYKKAFEQIKIQKAFEKHGKDIESEKIQYQIGETYYKKLLFEMR